MIGLQQERHWPHHETMQAGSHHGTSAYLMAVMNDRQSKIMRVLIVGWLVALIFFWVWWLRPEHWAAPGLMIVNSMLLAWATFLPGWFLFFVLRMRRPNVALPLPDVRVAMIVTKAPSEPWSTVQETLEGMLRQSFPRPYAVWLADEDPAPETLEWCRSHGVEISSRKGVSAYHLPTWPRRTKCKEGNLAYFYDHYGYRQYDVVVQLDADHVPTPGYLLAMVRPFANPGVGYVAAPSICDKNATTSWAVRARLFAEAPFHGALQAGYNDGFAPSCIGSHYAIRTCALREIGGLGPELAEDFTTTLMMSAYKWEGVFAFDAEAHGDGPANFADYIVQDFQWARSLVNVLLDRNINRRYWSMLSPRAKLKLGFGQIWYPIYAFHMLIAYLCPIIALSTRTPWANVYLPDFFLRSAPLALASLVTIVWMQKQGWMRPVDSRVWSWEAILFQFTKWPWVLWGVVQAIVGTALGKQFGFRVTPKGDSVLRPLPLAAILPYVIIAGASALTVLWVSDTGAARGYAYFCLSNAIAYSLILVAIIALHVRESRLPFGMTTLRMIYRPVIATVATLVVVLVAAVSRGESAFRAVITPSPHLHASMQKVASSWQGTGDNLLGILIAGAGLLLFMVLVINVVGRLLNWNTSRGYSRYWSGTLSIITVGVLILVSNGVAIESAASKSARSQRLVTAAVATPMMNGGPASLAPLPTAMPPATEPSSAPVTTTPTVAAPSPSLSAGADQRRFWGAYDPQSSLLADQFSVEMFYTDFYSTSLDNLTPRLQGIAANRRTPLVTLEPWPLLDNGRSEESLLDDLAAGRYDAELARVAASFREYHGEIVIRFAHEMELADVYPWGNRSPDESIAAYRYVHQFLTRESSGAQLLWLWSPAGNGNAVAYYPGDDIVDFVGFTLLGTEQFDRLSGAEGRRTFAQVMDEKWARARGYGKPVVIAELGVSGPAVNQTIWLADMFARLDQYPELRGVIYFNALNAINKVVTDPPDYRISWQQWQAAQLPPPER